MDDASFGEAHGNGDRGREVLALRISRADRVARFRVASNGEFVLLTSSLHRARVGLALALLAAAMLRFWGLSQGIGFSPGADEPEIMERAVRMMKTGDLNPHFFDYPGLYIYVQAAVAVLRFLTGAIQGKWSGLGQAPTEDFYLWGRAVTALLGTATVWAVYRAGLRWGRTTALLAAVLMAVMPMHVRECHYALTDVPATFVVMVTFVLSLRAHERETMKAFVYAAAAAGVAGALKYNGVLAIFMPLVACTLTPRLRGSRLACATLIVLTMILAFLLAAPYTLLDLPTFLNQFARLSSEYRAPPVISEPIWLVYLKHLRLALQWPGGAIVILGIVVGVWRVAAGPDRLRWTLVVGFPLLYFRFISHQNLIFGRYLLPLIPFLSLLGAIGVVSLVAGMRGVGMDPRVRNAATVALTLLAIAPPAYTAINYSADAAKTWTQALAYDWIRRELPPGTAIRLEGSLALKLPATYRTSVAKQLRLDGTSDYAGRGIQYLVASSQCFGPFFQDPASFPAEYDDYQRIFAETEEVARFMWSADHPGPELRILKVKHP